MTALVRQTTIVLRDVMVRMHLGIHAHERAAPQRVILNARVSIDPDAPDGYWYDYDALHRFITALDGARIDLHEQLLDRIAAFVMADAHVAALWLSSSKPDIFGNAAGAGIEVAFTRVQA